MTQADQTTIAITPPPPAAAAGRVLEFDILRALCALGVLGIHISGYYWDLPARDPSPWHLALYAITNEAVRYALFGFMFISGALITMRYRAQFHFGAFISRRVITILLPYLAWVAIYFALNLHGHPHALAREWARHGLPGHLKMVTDWLLFGTWPHLYFICMLFQMYLLYALAYRPLTWLLSTPRRVMGLLAGLAVLYVGWAVFRTPAIYESRTVHLPWLLHEIAHNPNRIALEWLTPFGIGLAFGAYRQGALDWVRRHRVLLWEITLGTLCATAAISAAPWLRTNDVAKLLNYGWVTMGHLRFPVVIELIMLRQLYALGFTLLVLSAANRALQRQQRPAVLRGMLTFASASFGIYLAHPIVLEYFRRKGLTAALYHTSALLYLLALTAITAGLSYLFVAGVTALGKRVPVLAWLPKLLFGS